MKKITAMLLCILLMLALVGCGAEENSNEITALYDEGYTYSLTSYDDTSWVGIFQIDESFDSVLLVKAAMTAEQYEDYGAISFEDDDYEAKQLKILGQLTDVTVTDITDKVPSQTELDSWIGATMGELEDAGFEPTGYSGDEETGYSFFYDGPAYSLTVTPAEGSEVSDIDDYSVNDLRELPIGAVEFTGFSFNLLEVM